MHFLLRVEIEFNVMKFTTLTADPPLILDPVVDRKCTRN